MKMPWPRGRKAAPASPNQAATKSAQPDQADNEIEPVRLARVADDPSARPPHATTHTVAGERSIPSVNRARSVRTLISHALAMGMLALLVGGFLLWYYATQYAKASEAQSTARKTAESRTAGELKLAPLGRVDPPQPRPAAIAAVAQVNEAILGPAPPPPESIAFGAATGSVSNGAPPPKTPQQLALDRQLGQPVLLHTRTAPRLDGPPHAQAAFPTLQSGTGMPPSLGSPSSALATMLHPTSTPAVRAEVLPTRRFLLAKGAFIDCTLETAIDSTFDGMVTCIGASDVYSADGTLVVLERGTKYVGEKRGEVKQGQGRVFLLWHEARTPTGVVVNLASPGTDELGRAGVSGVVDNHFWDRFGAAILISVIDGTLQGWAASQKERGGGTSIVMNPQGARDVMAEVLKSTVAIPPTVIKNQGERIQVLVARDVDFRGVYALRTDVER
jgi:type IV secretion system protein VirB10